MPVVFFCGKSDWAVGPEYYRRAHFPKMLLRGSDTGNVRFLENSADLERAIAAFQAKHAL